MFLHHREERARVERWSNRERESERERKKEAKTEIRKERNDKGLQLTYLSHCRTK